MAAARLVRAPPVFTAHGPSVFWLKAGTKLSSREKTMTARLFIVNFRQRTQRGASPVNLDAALRKDHAHD
jgi:hypothetical protein